MIVECINDDWKANQAMSNVATRPSSIYEIKGVLIPCPKKGDIVEVINSIEIADKLGYFLKEYNFPFPNEVIYKADHFAEVDVNINEVTEILEQPLELILL